MLATGTCWDATPVLLDYSWIAAVERNRFLPPSYVLKFFFKKLRLSAEQPPANAPLGLLKVVDTSGIIFSAVFYGLFGGDYFYLPNVESKFW